MMKFLLGLGCITGGAILLHQLDYSFLELIGVSALALAWALIVSD